MKKVLIQELIDKIDKNRINILKVNKALNFADYYHKGQKRLTGEDFICHPIKVAISSLENDLCQDEEVLIASLLHDTVEDNDVTFADIYSEFGQNITRLVEGLTRKKRISALTIDVVIDALLKNNGQFVKAYLNKVKLFAKGDDIVSYFDFVNHLIDALKSLKHYSNISGNEIKFCYPLFESVTDILLFVEMLNNLVSGGEEISVKHSLDYVFKNYEEKLVKKICLIKTLDRLDNLASIHIFDKDKQERIKQNTIKYILPLPALINFIFGLKKMADYVLNGKEETNCIIKASYTLPSVNCASSL